MQCMDTSRDEREQLTHVLINVGRLLHSRGIYAARAGNMSTQLSDGRILITRSGTHKGLLTASDLLLLAPDGTPLEEGQATSELPLHLASYAARADVRAVLHAHPPACTTLAMLNQTLNARMSEEGQLALGDVPLLPPAGPGDPDGAVRWGTAVQGGAWAALLAQHGVIVVGRDVHDALVRLETCEFIADVQWRMAVWRNG